MTREDAIRMLRREIECLSHTKCEDCILEKVCDPMQTPSDDKYIEAYAMAIKALEQEPEWHDSENPPKEDGYILLSFSNFSIPLVGRYDGNEEDGGNYYIGDDDTSALSQDIYVNGWMELPKCRED